MTLKTNVKLDVNLNYRCFQWCTHDTTQYHRRVNVQGTIIGEFPTADFIKTSILLLFQSRFTLRVHELTLISWGGGDGCGVSVHFPVVFVASKPAVSSQNMNFSQPYPGGYERKPDQTISPAFSLHTFPNWTICVLQKGTLPTFIRAIVLENQQKEKRTWPVFLITKQRLFSAVWKQHVCHKFCKSDLNVWQSGDNHPCPAFKL